MSLTIKPFRATYYNLDKIKKHSDVICPPYDVINKKQLKALRKRSKYNYSHFLIADNGNYKKSAAILNDFIKKNILVDDSSESFYLYEQKFKVNSKVIRRFGILALLKMDKKGIFPHEHTHKAPKADRKKMITAVKANLSPIFVIADKKINALKNVYGIYSRKKPFFEFKDGDGNDNRVWKIQDKKHISQISSDFQKAGLIIADGHHRFEISYDYFKKNKSKFKDINYLLAYATDCQSGLTVLPTHRVVTISDKDSSFFNKLDPYFDLNQVSKVGLEKKMSKSKGFCLGICRSGKFYFLSLKNPKILDKIANKAYKQIDTYVFHELFLPLFDSYGPIEYTHTISEAKELSGKSKTAFIVRAASMDSLLEVSSKGLRLPQKSTYFYPKVMSGVVLRRFERSE